MKSWWIALCLLLLAAACGSPKHDADSSSIPLEWRETLSSIPLTSDADRTDSLRIVADSAIYRLGDPALTELEEFGWFSEAVLLEDGSAALPDLRNRQLLVVSPDGSVDLLARVGEGPGEVRHPSSVFRSGPQELDVIDNAIMRRTRFRVVGGFPEVAFSAKTSSQPHGACKDESGFLAVEFNRTTGTTFARYDSAGNLLSTFGSPFHTGSRLANGILTQGRLICGAAGGTILFAGVLGDLLAFDTAGVVLWRRKLRDFAPHRITDGGSTFAFGGLPDSAESATSLKALLRLDQRMALVQLGVYVAGEGGTNRDRLELARVESYLIELSTGREAGHQSDLAVALSSTATRLLLFGEEPQPWVELRGYRILRSP